MGRKLTYRFTKNCPQTKKSQTIQINYLESPLMGTMSTTWKKDAFHCPAFNDCPIVNQGNIRNCPLYLAAPENPI